MRERERERERERARGGYHILSDNSVSQQVRREDLRDMETDHTIAWKQFSKLIDVRERRGGPYLSDKSGPPASPEGGDMQTNHLRNSFQS